jgi:flagellar secretion chaperone FliS
MFASTYPSRSSARHQLGGLYQQVGVETQLTGASPHHLVMMLFDGFMEAVAQARGAMRAKQIEAKGQAIGRAIRILEEGLRAGLNMRAGGPLANDLDDLYTYVTNHLTLANLRNDERELEECMRLMQPLRDAWLSIAAQANGASNFSHGSGLR